MPLKVTIEELVKDFYDDDENGARGYGGRLDIRPPYQRAFVYDQDQQDAVIDTVMKGYPLNVMYWAVRDDGSFEIIDGQQRTVSIAKYNDGDYSCLVDGYLRVETSLTHSQRQRFLSYELTVYVCEGDEDEKLEWFKTVNIAGERLRPQEIRNAVYAGKWVTSAKKVFSKIQGPAQRLGGKYLKDRSADRQEILEIAISWRSNRKIEEYMSRLQHDPSVDELWEYFEGVVDWIELNFINRENRKDMFKQNDWGYWYNLYKDRQLDPYQLEKEIAELIDNEEVQNSNGIVPYVLTREEKHLNLRKFRDSVILAQFKKQNGKCIYCEKTFKLNAMEPDHIKPWSKGGKSEKGNCQMLCKECNRKKSAK
ncbi:MAG: DUF262 domain-containing protein [Gammaproteobacteria bacterium]|nr:DUF262 domain-containing protein [Gammaproteobacteria bacterium]